MRALRHPAWLAPPPKQTGGRRKPGRNGGGREGGAFGTNEFMESAGLSRASGYAVGDSDWARAVVCRADLPASGAQSHAGTTIGRACSARPAGVWIDLRGRVDVPFWGS